MTRTEILNCAAILTAGILANEANALGVCPEIAVDLMEQIAEEITKQEKDRQQGINKSGSSPHPKPYMVAAMYGFCITPG